MKTLTLMNVKKEDVLNRNEMKGIIAGSTGGSCTDTCNSIAQACFAAAGYSGPLTSVCRRQLKCCQSQCAGLTTC